MSLELVMMQPEDISAMMETLAYNIDRSINGVLPPDKPRPNGFMLMVFPLEAHMGKCNYISNAERGDMVALFKCQLARLEGWPDQAGHA